MIDLKGYEDVQPVMPGEFAKLPAGGYICQVINAEITKSKAGNPMLVLFIDIAEGDFQGHFKNAFSRVKSFNSDLKWDKSGIYRQLIFNNNGVTSQFFKGLITCFEKSNPHIAFKPHAFDENILRGSLIGFIFAEEEFMWNGDIKSRVFPKFPRLVDDIRQGKFTVPDIKRLDKTTTSTTTPAQSKDPFGGSPVDDFDTPF